MEGRREGGQGGRKFSSLSVGHDSCKKEVLPSKEVEVLAVSEATVVHLTLGAHVIQLVVLTAQPTFPVQ